MKHLLIIGTLCAISGVTQANAGIIFTPGNNPQQPGQENILFNMDQTGSMVTGTTQNTSTTVDFSSTSDTLETTANGQAMVTASDGTINNLTITLAGGETYQSLILNPFLGGSVAPGPATVTVTATDGTFTYGYPSGLGNGNNFLTITTSDGEAILSTTITSSTGFADLKQPRISGASSTPGPGGTGQVPEPNSMLMLAGGLLAVCLARRVRTTP